MSIFFMGLEQLVLVNAYDKDGAPLPVARWLREGNARYVNQKEFPAILNASGLQLPSTAFQNKPGTGKILTEKNLAGYLCAVIDADMLIENFPKLTSVCL